MMLLRLLPIKLQHVKVKVPTNDLAWENYSEDCRWKGYHAASTRGADAQDAQGAPECLIKAITVVKLIVVVMSIDEPPPFRSPSLQNLKAETSKARIQAYLSVNKEMITLYWSTGNQISGGQKSIHAPLLPPPSSPISLRPSATEPLRRRPRGHRQGAAGTNSRVDPDITHTVHTAHASIQPVHSSTSVQSIRSIQPYIYATSIHPYIHASKYLCYIHTHIHPDIRTSIHTTHPYSPYTHTSIHPYIHISIHTYVLQWL